MIGNELRDTTCSLVDLKDQPLEPNGTVLLPLWIHGHKAGKEKLQIMFAYNSDVG